MQIQYDENIILNYFHASFIRNKINKIKIYHILMIKINNSNKHVTGRLTTGADTVLLRRHNGANSVTLGSHHKRVARDAAPMV